VDRKDLTQRRKGARAEGTVLSPLRLCVRCAFALIFLHSTRPCRAYMRVQREIKASTRGAMQQSDELLVRGSER
jgi:hypothetical protein